jgi:hypothetical protein
MGQMSLFTSATGSIEQQAIDLADALGKLPKPERIQALNQVRVILHQVRYTQPIVGWQVDSRVKVVDGFHRVRVGKESQKVRQRICGYLPVVFINQNRTDRRDRMAATIRHNRARGVHGVVLMTDIVASLIREGWDDLNIAKELGMDADEVLRFKQNTGLAELFKDHPYSHAWE